MHLVAEKGQMNAHGSAILCDGPQNRAINFLLTIMCYPAGFVFLCAWLSWTYLTSVLLFWMNSYLCSDSHFPASVLVRRWIIVS